MRRPVRSPSRETTAASSSSECRLPFIKSSALPSRTICTARAAASWLCSTSTISTPARSIFALFAISAIFADGPTRIGAISPCSAASIAPESAVSSHGCATAVGIGSSPWHRSSRCSYLPVPVVCFMTSLVLRSGSGGRRPGPGFPEDDREDDRETDAPQKRLEGGLEVFVLRTRAAPAEALRSAHANTGASSALNVKFRKLITPVAVPESDGGLASLITVYGNIAAPDAIPVAIPNT